MLNFGMYHEGQPVRVTLGKEEDAQKSEAKIVRLHTQESRRRTIYETNTGLYFDEHGIMVSNVHGTPTRDWGSIIGIKEPEPEAL